MKATRNRKKAKGGNCYQAAFGYVSDQELAYLMGGKQGSDPAQTLTLVHGVLLRIDGIEMGHAWVEKLEDGITTVLDIEQGLTLPKAQYYAECGVIYARSYTPKEARKTGLAHQDYGPWDERVLAAAHA